MTRVPASDLFSDLAIDLKAIVDKKGSDVMRGGPVGSDSQIESISGSAGVIKLPI
jgi:hypothetical protein